VEDIGPEPRAACTPAAWASARVAAGPSPTSRPRRQASIPRAPALDW